MVTRIKIDREYIIQGVVIDRATQEGVRGALVEAWDRDTRYHDMLGQVVTGEDGQFTIGFDTDYFGDYAPDRAPDVFYKVFLDQVEVLNTYETPQRNLPKGLTRVTLDIELAQFVPSGRDRVTSLQALKLIDWWQASDFRGAYNQARDKGRTLGKLSTGSLGKVLEDFDLRPIQPKSTREREIIDQSPEAARAALSQQQVEVTKVQPVSELGTRAGLRLIADYPLRLRAGDRVTLYEENGVVKYYTRDPVPKAAVEGDTVMRLDSELQGVRTRVADMDTLRAEVETVKAAHADGAARAAEEAAQVQAQVRETARLQQQLDTVLQANAEKDVQLAKLRDDLQRVTKAQDTLSTRIPLDRLTALEQQIKRLSPGTPVSRKTPVAKKAATPAKKTAATPAAKKVARPAAKAAAKKAPAKKTGR